METKLDFEQLENKIGFQIQFLTLSGADKWETVERIKNICIDFSNQQIKRALPIILKEVAENAHCDVFPMAVACVSKESITSQEQEILNKLGIN